MIKARRQRSHVTDKVFSIDQLINNYGAICIPRKRRWLVRFGVLFRQFLDSMDSNPKELGYYKYLLWLRNSPGMALRIMNNEKKQFEDIKKNGLRHPLDMVVIDGNYIMMRGYRRLFMLNKLGYKKIPTRVFKSLDFYTKLLPQTRPEGRLETIAGKHFQKKLDKSTDKYWLHGYLPEYEKLIGTPSSILELGVMHGASLDLWKEAFPRADVYGLDHKDHALNHKVFIGGQDDPVLAEEVSNYGPFDLIIDDASHRPDHTMRSFGLYFPMCKRWYVIEDIYSNYSRGKRTGSFMGHIHKLIDEMNLTCAIKSFHLYYNIVFIEKRNT